ncbi:VOC family protein [Cellulomonas sp. WB94]|uniref:VOC family protein n=1 Tax=Cellulomonas sp. WB94 TaxID=2173174 RepID=UPI001304DCD0|nr:VOC family protein [Cellulomonas sp. WB94]
MRPRLQEIVVDCADPAALAEFWGGLLEARWAVRDESWAMVDADPLLLAFQRVPEPKSSPKNRLHLDVQVADAGVAIARATARGARVLREPEVGPGGDGYVVLADPEGNEFCFVIDNGGTWTASIRAALDAAPEPPA